LTIYLDNMAATPIDPRVAEHYRAAMVAHVGNAHSVEHSVGVAAQWAIDEAGEALLKALGSAAGAVTFTPGASAALWLAVEDAIARANRRPARVAATAVEHPALLSALRNAERQGRVAITLIPVDERGAPRIDAIERTLAGGVDLVCTMAANNEVGTVTDLAAIGALVASTDTRHLVDASQATGRIDMGDAAKADLLIVSGAKIYGPRRVGAIIGVLCTQAAGLAHDVFGSPDPAGAAALAHAAVIRVAERDDDERRIASMRHTLQSRLMAAVPDLRINGDQVNRLAGSLHVSTPHLPGDAAVGRLWGQVALSTGAACQSGAPGPSHVLLAMDIPEWARDGAVRIGVGRFNTIAEIEEAADLIASALNPAELERKRA
jgi:cysteine desulfurase